MGRKSLKDIRQREIIEVFYAVAKREGLENTSIAKIAREMNTNPSLIIHYFQTKEDLIYELIDYILSQYQLIFQIEREGATREALVETIDKLFSKKWNDLFDDGLSFSCYALIFRNETVKEKFKSVLDLLHTRLATLIRQCAENGEIRLTEDPRVIADLIFVIVDGAYYYLSLVSDPAEFDRKLTEYKLRALRLLSISLIPVSAGDRGQAYSHPDDVDGQAR